MKNRLEELRKKYETKDFIKYDPIQFPHNYKTKEDIEIAGFISALFAYGKREVFIKKLKFLFSIMNDSPYEFLLNWSEKSNVLDGFSYRFMKDEDIKALIGILSDIYKKKNNLQNIFYKNSKENIRTAELEVIKYFYSKLECKPTQGFKFMMCNYNSNSALKRINMFLRWMIRGGEVDLGIWNIYKTSELLIPLDTHVGNISRQFGLLKRTSNDYKAALELTNKLKEFDPYDPAKYDFALFGLGVNNS